MTQKVESGSRKLDEVRQGEREQCDHTFKNKKQPNVCQNVP